MTNDPVQPADDPTSRPCGPGAASLAALVFGLIAGGRLLFLAVLAAASAPLARGVGVGRLVSLAEGWVNVALITAILAVLLTVIALVRRERLRRTAAAVAGVAVLSAALALSPLARPLVSLSENNCFTNLKQLALGLLAYADQHGGRLPRADAWVRDSFPCIKDCRIYMCPSDRRADASRPRLKDLLPDQKTGRRVPLGYTINVYLSGKNLKAIPHPAEVPLLWDGTELADGHGSAAFRHNGGLNVAFCDGHCKWMSSGEFLSLSLRPQRGSP